MDCGGHAKTVMLGVLVNMQKNPAGSVRGTPHQQALHTFRLLHLYILGHGDLKKSEQSECTCCLFGSSDLFLKRTTIIMFLQ